jgi:N-acetylglucosaminyldiphosphoundecaprenol N-acetyl-beta-D-mannosaminyltransferase
VPGAADAAARIIRERYPKAQICGTYCPPHETFATDAEQAKIGDIIREAAPDVLLVGLGAPKQEKWIAANKQRLGVPVSIGVGGSFEMAAGIVQRAPLSVQKFGMEWAYRLVQDPSRLWRRYLRDDLPFLALTVLRMTLGLRHPDPTAVKPDSAASPEPVSLVRTRG